MRSLVCALALAAAAMIQPAMAGDLKPLQAHSIELGGLSGVAYYTVVEAGYRVVATLAEGESGQPLRFATTLAPGQGLTIAVPDQDGRPGGTLELVRRGDRLMILGPQLALR